MQMRTIAVVVVLLVSTLLASCGEPESPGGESPPLSAGSPTLESTASRGSAAIPATMIPDSTRYFLVAQPEDGQLVDDALMQQTSDIVERRLDEFGLTTFGVQHNPVNAGLIVVDVQSANLSESELAIVEGLMTERGLFEVIDSQTVPLAEGTDVSTTLEKASGADGKVYETIVSSLDLLRVYEKTDPFGVTMVVFELNESGGDRIEEYTSSRIGQPISIVVDHVVVNTGTIMSTLRSLGIVTNPSEPDIRKLMIQLNHGPLPVAMGIAVDTDTSTVATPTPVPRTSPTPDEVQSPTTYVTPTVVSELRLDIDPGSDAPSDFEPFDIDTYIEVMMVIWSRLDGLGLSEATVDVEEIDGLLVDIPDMSSPEAERIARLLTIRSTIEIVDTEGDFLEEGTLVATTLAGNLGAEDSFIGPTRPTVVGGADIVDAVATTDASGAPVLELYFSEDAASRLGEFTASHIGQPIVLAIDNMIVMSLTINEPFATTFAVTGLPADADWFIDLAFMLQHGQLPVSVGYEGW